MQTKWPWFERTFDFSFPPEKLPDLVERLRGTPGRARSLVAGLSHDQLVWREREGTWSIQENIGHLWDLQPLWIGRVHDILSGKDTMRAADLKNQATFDAHHNDRGMDEILTGFASKRNEFVDLVESVKHEQYGLSALHPRLRVPLRIVDLCLFESDHDDYHLARVTYLKRAQL
jgi:hypothetical protein